MRGTARRASRIAAYVASGGLAITSTILAVTPAEAVTHDPIGVNKGATWLEGELDNGLMHNPNFGGFDDYGLSVDAGLALQDVGGHPAAVQDIKDAMAGHVNDYVTPFGGPHSYTGGLAKLATFVGHPADTNFGGQNLITQLEARVASTAPITGRIQDTGYTPGDQFDDDTANVLGQAYAVHALNANASAKTVAARDFLLKQQCPEGSFRLNFTANKTVSGQSCTSNAQRDTDATAIAILQLQGVAGTATTIAKARTWLRSVQKSDGSWGGAGPTVGSNSNSTGLAAQALGNSVRSENAAKWLRDHQATPLDRCNQLGAFVGAIGYDDEARQDGRDEGITDESSDQWRRASSQALPALRFLPLVASAPITLSGPSGFRKAGTAATLTTRGVLDGTQLCLNGVGLRVRQTPNADPWTKTFTLPAGTANRVYTVRDAYGHADTASISVLGKKTLSVVTSKHQVKRSGQVTVTVSGMTSGEHSRIYYKGVLKKAGTAGALGRMTATFNVGQSLGTKDVTGTGHFPDIRKGATTIKVVR